jgi:hypothetical protein
LHFHAAALIDGCLCPLHDPLPSRWVVVTLDNGKRNGHIGFFAEILQDVEIVIDAVLVEVHGELHDAPSSILQAFGQLEITKA